MKSTRINEFRDFSPKRIYKTVFKKLCFEHNYCVLWHNNISVVYSCVVVFTQLLCSCVVFDASLLLLCCIVYCTIIVFWVPKPTLMQTQIFLIMDKKIFECHGWKIIYFLGRKLRIGTKMLILFSVKVVPNQLIVPKSIFWKFSGTKGQVGTKGQGQGQGYTLPSYEQQKMKSLPDHFIWTHKQQHQSTQGSKTKCNLI